MAGLDKLQPSLVKSLTDARVRLVAAQAERIVRVEHIGERVLEEELDEQERVRVRRTIERTIVRNELRERYASLIVDAAVPAVAVPRVREQLDADLDHVSAAAIADPAVAAKCFAELLPAADWPTVLIMADGADAAASLAHHLSSLGLRCAPDDALRRFGIVSAACPPDVEFVAAIAESPLIAAMADPSAPVVAPAPQALETHMLEARNLLNVTPEMMAGFGHDVTLAVLDTGIDLAHPALARLKLGDYHNFTRFEDADDQGHGTHVASIAAGDDRTGAYSGIAPRAHLVAGKVIPGRMSGQLEDVLRGMAWAVFEKRADVLSLSIADGETPANGRSIWSRACDEAYRHGTIVCVAAGNPDLAHEDTVMVPADAAHAIAVGAIDKEKCLAEFSAKGSSHPGRPLYGKPNCVAPGVGIIAARSSYSEFGAYGGNPLYTQLSGTSMAAPAVAGCLALVKSKARSMGWDMTPAELLDVFYSACQALTTADGEEYSREHEIGRGLPDMQLAFARVEALAPVRTQSIQPARPEPVVASGGPVDTDHDLFGPQFLGAFERKVREMGVVVAPHTGDRFDATALRVQEPRRTFCHARRYEFKKKAILREEKQVFSLTALALNDNAFQQVNGALQPRADLIDNISTAFTFDEDARHIVGVYSPAGWPAAWRANVHDRGHITFYLVEKPQEADVTSRWDVYGSEKTPFERLFDPETETEEMARAQSALDAHAELARHDGVVPLQRFVHENRVSEKAIRAAIGRPQARFMIQERRGEHFILRAGVR